MANLIANNDLAIGAGGVNLYERIYLGLPSIVIDAMNIFHSLGNRVYPDIGYMGKDYTNLSLLKKLYGIKEHEEEYLYDLLLFLDSQAIESSQKKLKAEMDKIKNK